MTKKINGFSGAGQFLTGGLNFYTVVTTLDIRPDASKGTDAQGVDQFGYYEATEAQKRLDKLVETISTRAQPVIMNSVVATTATAADADVLDVAVGGAVYKMTFAIEHNMAWEVSGSANPTLAESLDGVAGFENDGVAAGNVAVIRAEFL